MKHRYLIALFALTLLGGAAMHRAQAGDLRVSLDDIVHLNQRGLADQTILLFLENRELDFVPDIEAIDRLLSNGVSEEIIRYLLVQVPPDDVGETTYISAAPYYPLGFYPDYYFAPYYYGATFSWGFPHFLHNGLGYYAGAGPHWPAAQHGMHGLGHAGPYEHAPSHAARHDAHDAGGHSRGAHHGGANGLHGAADSGGHPPGGRRPHVGAAGGRAHGDNGQAHLVSDGSGGHRGGGHRGGGHGGGHGGH